MLLGYLKGNTKFPIFDITIQIANFLIIMAQIGRENKMLSEKSAQIGEFDLGPKSHPMLR